MPLIAKEYLHALVIMLAPFTFGAIILYPSPTSLEICEAHGITTDSTQWALYNAVSSLFAIVGPPIVQILLKLFSNSRKKTLFTIAVFSFIGWLLNILTKFHIWVGIVMRAVIGVIMGMNAAIGPLYLVEIAPEGKSGLFGTLNQIGISVGQVFFNFVGPTVNYMILCVIGAVIPLIQCIFVLFIDESPAVVIRSSEEPLESKEQSDIDQNDLEKICENKVVNESLWRMKHMGSLAAGILTMFFQQFSGINAIVTNQAELLGNTGLSLDGSTQGGIASIAQVVGLFVMAPLVDKIGRKAMWVASSFITAVSLLIFALYDRLSLAGYVPLVTLLILQFGFGLGLGPLPWFLVPQYFSDEIPRKQASTVISSVNFVFTFITIVTWSSMKRNMTFFGALLFFTCIEILSILFGVICIKEPTKNLDDIEKIKESQIDNEEMTIPNVE
ncbi:major facilitator superfamily transporter [Tritrichomonas foetus]|uniref:Major facilitator superfamily transporter n=1 Tax=Tritrichomonas foetus TaxID=1144522 RepID=A0A1J4JG47_9EUKA|nr:major facilitator superfamily transporter [Tritrichomonas foetus]|eukprot:OHS96421.1 major facilitator superfamily transporter [Tritrichomonas foetus]